MIAGNVSVTERFVVHFNGSWNGIYRMIPVEYDAPGGLNYTLRLRSQLTGDPLAAYEALRAANERDGTTVVVVTHDERVLRIADRLLVVEDGRATERPLSTAARRTS